MSENRLSDIQHRVDQLYHAGEYRPGYDLMCEAGDRFPDDLHEIHYWCICLASMMDAGDAALDLLEAEVQQGNWYSKKQLREESDLTSLQGLARFEHLAGECLVRQQKAQAEAQAELFIQEPAVFKAVQGKPPVLLALHGNSQNARQALEAWSPVRTHGYQLAVVQSSQIVSHDAYSWNDWERAEKDLSQFLPALSAETDPARRFIGGFSMGAGLAIRQALVGESYQPSGFITVGTYLPDVEILRPLLEGSRNKPRGYMVVGDLDDPCFEISRTLASLFEAYELPCYLEVHEGLVHDYPVDFADTLAHAFDFFLNE